MSLKDLPVGTESRRLIDEVYELGLLASQTSDLSVVLELMLRRILTGFDVDFVGVGLMDESRENLELHLGVTRAGQVISKGYSQPIDKGVMGRVVDQGQSVLVEDVSRFDGYVDLIEGMRAEAATPLRAAGRVIGALTIESKRAGAFGKPEMGRLEALAIPVAMAIENARLFVRLNLQMNQLTLINRVSRILASTAELQPMLDLTVTEVRCLLGLPLVAIGLVDDTTGRIEMRAVSTDVNIELQVGHSQAIGEGIAGRCVNSSEPIYVPDTRADASCVLMAASLRSEFCCPLWDGENSIGVLDVEHTELDAFDESLRLTVQILADHVSQAVVGLRNRERLEHLHEELSRMVVHDLRSPLTVISSSLAMEKRRNADREPSKYLKLAAAACGDLSRLISSILSVYQLEAGQPNLRPQTVQLDQLAGSLVERQAIVAEANRLTLVGSWTDPPYEIELDPDLISRVLENLLANALRHTPMGGKVELSILAASQQLLDAHGVEGGEGLLVSLQDDGPGVARDDQARIFDKFTSLEAGRNGRKISTGLGLAFCQQAVRAHGGAIWVESAPDQGAKFCVLLPLSPPTR
jgi:signal transduction histidine kinase